MVYDAGNFFKGWFDSTLFVNITKPLKASDILNVVYNVLSEQAHEKIYQDETDMEYDDDIKDKLMYLDGPKTKMYYQQYKNQFILHTENFDAEIDSPINAANFINNWVNKGGSKGSV
eukprot:1924050-Ditylum_brightwellii.AAC.1